MLRTCVAWSIVEGVSSKFDTGGWGGGGVGLKSVHEGSMGGLKCSRKIPVKEFI